MRTILIAILAADSRSLHLRSIPILPVTASVRALRLKSFNYANFSFSRFASHSGGSAVSTLIEQRDQDEDFKVSAKGTFMFPNPRFTSSPFGYLQELELRIESLTNLGDGIARVNGGWVVMVGKVVPGELVRARVFRNHSNYSEATLVEVVEPSPHRVVPRCSLFGLCGGCQYQHMTLESQREWKRQQVLDVLERIGGFLGTHVSPVRGSKEEYGYRSKITPHYDAPLRNSNGELRGIGFKRSSFPIPYYGIDMSSAKTDQIVDVPHCPIAVDSINQALPSVRKNVIDIVRKQSYSNDSAVGKRKKVKGATLLLRKANEGVVTSSKMTVTETVRGVSFKFLAGEFFQNNPFVLPDMVDYVIGEAKGDSSAKYLIDAYCGGGLFSLCSSKHFEECVGIEVSAAAVKCASENATLNNILNCHFIEGTANMIFKNINFDRLVTSVIIDPPRKGCDEKFLMQLFEFKPKRVVYVSCDPATQARDAKSIVSAGYEILNVVPFDLFPQTRHIESVITFQLA